MIDLWGATWKTRESYQLHPDAQRYEFYEKDFSGLVRAPCFGAKHYTARHQLGNRAAHVKSVPKLS